MSSIIYIDKYLFLCYYTITDRPVRKMKEMRSSFMKKVLSAVLAMSVATSMLAFSASAVSPDLSAMPASQLAYMDVNSASPETQQAILNARAEIIYGDQAWSLYGDGYVVDLKTGKATQVPKFEDLFPGWDIPVFQNNGQQILSFAPRAAQASNDIFYGNCDLKLYSGTELGCKVVTFNGTGNIVGAFAKSGPVDARYGISVLEGDRGIGWYPNLTVKEGVKFETSTYFDYSVHASARNAQSVDTYRMVVTERLEEYEKLDIYFNELS